MEKRTWKWTDAHFYRLPSQTNIYGCTKIVDPANGTNKLLVASLVGSFFLIDYQRIFDKLTPSTKEVQFTYIPGEAEIVSIDASNSCCHGQGLTIGITFFKMEENESKQFLNIYSASQKGEEFNLQNVAQGCIQSIELQFIPYHLTHIQLISTGSAETVFLLSGSDSKVHLYREINYQHTYKEYECDEFLPELKGLSSVVLWLDVYYYNKNSRRVTVCGQQNGSLTVYIVDVNTVEIISQYSIDHDSPITYVKVFSLHNKVDRPSFLPDSDDILFDEDENEDPQLNILVLSALIPATVYRNILQTGLKETLFLPDSNKYDAILTGTILDIDFDGENEILIGTYGQEVLAYKLHSDGGSSKFVKLTNIDGIKPPTDRTLFKQRHKSGDSEFPGSLLQENNASRRVKSEENLSSSLNSDLDYVPLSSSRDTVIPRQSASNMLLVQQRSPVKELVGRDSFELLWQRGFPLPVVGINHLDIMGDGMEDLVIVTLRGIHILQPDLTEVANVVIERLKMLSEEQDGEDTDKQLTETIKRLTDGKCDVNIE